MFPLAGIVYMLTVFIGQEMFGAYSRNSEVGMFLVTGSITWAGIALYWCLLWRSSVKWNSMRTMGTALAALGTIIFGIIAGAIMAAAIPNGDGSGVGAFVGSILAIVLWLIATVFLWRETAAERAQRVKQSSKSAITCPTCGYNLTGLSEARCPECGSKFTLDELIALQSSAETAEIE
jgi:DNA-directed RNA polymerase subunit RPC12/RpoP